MTDWQPIETAPRDEVIMRWHVIWECPIAVERNEGRYQGGLEWITATKDQSWPEDAFTPHWQPLPAPPHDPARELSTMTPLDAA